MQNAGWNDGERIRADGTDETDETLEMLRTYLDGPAPPDPILTPTPTATANNNSTSTSARTSNQRSVISNQQPGKPAVAPSTGIGLDPRMDTGECDADSARMQLCCVFATAAVVTPACANLALRCPAPALP